MAYTEIHIDGQYELYGKFYCALSLGQDANPFFAAHLGSMASSPSLDKWNDLNGLNIFATGPSSNKLLPLKANLVLPAAASTDPFPLAVLIHGNARSYFKSGNPIPEVKSYRGYQYLQYYLADRGVASISVNVNVVNYLNLGGGVLDEQHRVEIALLWLSLLAQLNGTPVTTNQPIFLKMSAGGTLAELQEALNVTTGTQELLLQSLRTAIRGKIDLTKLGWMGHSRGGGAVQILQPFFQARIGSRPSSYTHQGAASPAGPSFTIAQDPVKDEFGVGDLDMHGLLYHYMQDLMAILGNPAMDVVKTVVSLQPNLHETLLSHPTTFFLVLASSHDTDVTEDSYNAYDGTTCPKAFMFSHGASHGRFNTVWRQLDYINTAINRQIACQSPIHMLSNAGHESLAKAVIGNALLAGLKAEHHRYRFYTGEVRATSLGQDIQRGWKFGFPFSTTPTVVPLTDRPRDVQDVTARVAVPGVRDSLQFRSMGSISQIYADRSRPFLYTRPGTNTVVMKIPIQPADQLVAKTHFSFRYTIEYNPRNRTERSRVKLQNYIVRLKGTSGQIGSDVDGRNVTVKSFVAYRTFDLPGGTCSENTKIVMQTAEIALSQFLTPGGHALTDLNQVNTIELELKPTRRSANVIWLFNDFAITTRNLPAPPAGFAIP